MSDRAIVLRETAISIVINMAISAALFVAMFGTHGSVDPDRLGRDCLPQAFMVALMGSLVPGLLACRRFAAGRPGRVARRAIAVGATSMLLAGGGGWLLCRSMPDAPIGYVPAFLAKVALGGIIAAIVTPLAIHDILGLRTRPA